MRVWRWLHAWPLWLLRASCLASCVVGAVVVVGLYVGFVISPWDPIELEVTNVSDAPATVVFDGVTEQLQPDDPPQTFTSDAHGKHAAEISPDGTGVSLLIVIDVESWALEKLTIQIK